MDSYLESLVKKDVSEPEEIKESEEAIEDSDLIEDSVEEAVEEEKSVEEAEEVDESEESSEEEEVKEAEEVTSSTKVDSDDPQVDVEGAKQIASNLLTAASVAKKQDNEKTKYTVGEVISVKDIRVFNVPSTKQPSKLISGNIIYQGEVDGFSIIDYMRPGFGTVKGYTQGI